MRSRVPLTVAIAACLYILSAGTPASAAGSLRGVWRGAWENSLGERGEGRLVVTREHGDLVSGEWDGDPFEGRRSGNEVLFTIHGAQKGCTNYEGRMVFFDDGVGGRLTYSAHNHCTDRRYSGSQRLRLVEEHVRQRFRGVWRGPWENSLGELGEGRLVVTREDGDLVSGDWGGDPFEGRREGNEVVFTIRGGQKGCTNYDGRMVFFEDGVSGRLTYSAHNHCTERRYSGSQRLRLEEGR